MQEKPKLFLSMIIKEDEPLEMVQRGLDSLAEYVDDTYITITYKDRKPAVSSLLASALKKQYKAKISFFKWTYSFADARNFAMEQMPKGPNVFFVWIDCDDVFQGAENLRPLIDDMVYHNLASIFFNYLYMVELDEKGQVREVLIEHKRERVVRNDDTFKWVGMLHETLIEQRVENIRKIFKDDCVVVHLSDAKRIDSNLERNIQILENQARAEQHRDPRTICYLGKAYFDKMNMVEGDQKKIYCQLALELFREYLEGTGRPGEPGYREGSGWAEERATIWNYVSEIFRLLNKPDEALEALTQAIDEAPQFPKYYIDKAMIYILKKDIPKAKHWLTLATTIQQPDSTILSTPRDLKIRALEVDYHVKMAEGKLDQAEEDIAMACKILPDSKQFEERLGMVHDLNMANKASQSVVFLAKYLEEKKEGEKIPHLIRSISENLQSEKFVSEMRHKFLPIKTWDKNEIAILCGQGFEPWSPDSIKTGLGGSEEAVVYLSQELTKLGWKVTVYASPAPAYKVGDYDGVAYKQWWELNAKDNFNILVLWRGIGFADFDFKAKYSLLWLHDVPNNPDFTEKRLSKVDKIAVLSEYHKTLMRMSTNKGFVLMPEEKVFLTSNGIPELSIKEWNGVPHRLIYISSADRGLVYLLNNWAEIKKGVPQAELDVYYGFEVFDAIHAGNPAKMAWKKDVMTALEQPGINYHGRVGHQELVEALSKSGVWAYPTDFQEISCISAMKAQALGAIPVVTNFAALKETVRNGFKLDMDITTQEGQKEYVKTLIDVLKHPEKQEEIRPDMMKWAQEYFLWKHVAEKWTKLFKDGMKGA